MGITSVRLDSKLLKALDILARKERVDRSTVMKKAIELGINDMKLEDALKRYQTGKISAWKASQEAGISLWEFLDEIKRRGIYFKTDESEMERMVEEFG